VPSLDHQTEIRRQGSVVRRTRRLVVLVRVRDVVRELAGTLLDLALVVGLGVVFVLFREALGFVYRHHVADERAVGDSAERVAGGADLAVDLEAAAEGAVVEGLVELLVLPWVLGRVEAAVVVVLAGSVRTFLLCLFLICFGVLTLLPAASWRMLVGRTGSNTIQPSRWRMLSKSRGALCLSRSRRIRRSLARRHCAMTRPPSASISSTMLDADAESTLRAQQAVSQSAMPLGESRPYLCSLRRTTLRDAQSACRPEAGPGQHVRESSVPQPLR